MDFNYQSQILLTKKGIIKLTACPVTRLVLFSELLTFLTNLLKSEDVSLSLAIQDSEIEWIIKSLLQCHNLEYELFDLQQIESLLRYPDGVLVQLNRLSPQSQNTDTTQNKGEGITLKEYELKQVARLVNFELAKDFETAYQIADKYPADYLDGIINARLIYLNPDAEKEAKKEQDNLSLLSELNKEFLGGGASTPQFKKE